MTFAADKSGNNPTDPVNPISVSLGNKQVTASSTQRLLSDMLAALVPPFVIPTTARAALISVETAPIRWTDDGQLPTTGFGQPVVAGQAFQFTGNLQKLRIIAQSGSPKLSINFYNTR